MPIARELREAVYRANMALAESGLVMGTFGNVSAVDRAAGVCGDPAISIGCPMTSA